MRNASRERALQHSVNARAAQRYLINQMRSRILHPPYEAPLLGKIYGYAWRVVAVLAVVGVVSYGFMKRRMRGAAFRADLAEEFAQHFHATNVTCGKTNSPMFKNNCSIAALLAEGAEGSFFTKLDAHALDFDLGYQFIRTDWTLEQLNINQLNLHLRTGGIPPVIPESPAASPSSPPPPERAVIPEFKTGRMHPAPSHLMTAGFGMRPDFAELEIKSYEVSDLGLSWGYSNTTEGSVQKTTATYRPEPDGRWKLVAKGGEFQQNWLKGLKMDDLEVLVGPEQVAINSASFTKGQQTTATLQGKITLGEMPQLDLNFAAKGMDLRALTPEPLKKFFYATADLQGRGTGTLNNALGLQTSFHGQLVAPLVQAANLKKTPRINAAEQPAVAFLTGHLSVLYALYVASGEERLSQAPLTSGTFDFTTGNNQIIVSNLDLQSNDLLRIRGGFTAREVLVESKKKHIVGREAESAPTLTYQIDSDFRIGLNPATYAAIPKVIQEKYFTEESEGFHWMAIKSQQENFLDFTKALAEEIGQLHKESLNKPER